MLLVTFFSSIDAKKKCIRDNRWRVQVQNLLPFLKNLMNKKNKQIIHALRMLYGAFNCNIYAKEAWACRYDLYFGERYVRESEKMYAEKSAYIKKAVAFIKKHALPIKYGVEMQKKYTEYGNYYVIPCVYFAYAGCQVSFHMPYDWHFTKSLKKYN